ncbi:hypothetical protein PPYR_08446 [Photinus pyralis]|uniref:Carboxylesterase type B domain-containing protein n=1 Tax=Photinus pyralis TaxID=7054 RepID=A0A5N4AJC6_PHOPY|nr:hypothetical protein PPYR_08446 [Photinus pyralis]
MRVLASLLGHAFTTVLAFFCAMWLVILLTISDESEASIPVHKYSTRVVRTKYGSLRGIIVHSHPPVEAFLGVPYATPPVGSLRYMPPVTPSLWKTTRLADRFSSVCPQRPPDIGNRTEALLEFPRGRLLFLEKLLPLLANQSEDCLYLNLYVPRRDCVKLSLHCRR